MMPRNQRRANSIQHDVPQFARASGSGAFVRRIERRSADRPAFMESWRKRLGVAVPPKDRVDIWIAQPDSLVQSKSALAVLSANDWSFLSELQRPVGREASAASRVLLRLALSRAANFSIAPAEWRFERTANNRPLVAEGLPRINFSVTHVDQFVGVAVSPTLRVGLDIECLDQDISNRTALAFCHDEERRSIENLTRTRKSREFVRLWVLKEAYSKMLGSGHSLDFNRVHFELDPAALSSDDSARRCGLEAEFETFVLARNQSLFQGSLALCDPGDRCVSADMQIITLLRADRRPGSSIEPFIS